jgi:iron complex outermembrane receptor protein
MGVQNGKEVWGIALTALACSVATPSLAQSNSATSVSNPETAAGTGANGKSGLGDIVVTANKRKESLTKVPIAVTALTSDAMKAASITDVSSLQQMVPGLEFPRNFDGATPPLRGIGSAFGIGATESVVAMYIDDVYVAQPSATTFDFNNVSQINILKGPQGTIYGRNAMAGVVDIHTPDPSHKTSVDVSADTRTTTPGRAASTAQPA